MKSQLFQSLWNPKKKKKEHLKLAERVDTLEVANKSTADKVKAVEEITSTTSKMLVRLQVMAVKEGEKELWNERNTITQFKVLGLNKSINQPNDFLKVLPTTSRDLLTKASVKEVKYHEIKESNGSIRTFHIISCHNLKLISKQLFSAKSDEEFKSIGLILKRSFGSKEKAWRKLLFQHHKSINPDNKCIINLNVLKCTSGDFYYDPFERKIFPLMELAAELLKKEVTP